MDILQSVTSVEIVLFFALAVVGFMVYFDKKNQKNRFSLTDIKRLPYTKGATLLLDTQRKFFHALQAVVGDQYAVFSRVSLFNFIDVKTGMNETDQRNFEIELKDRSIDFLLCHPRTTEIVAGVMLGGNRSDEEKKVVRQIFDEVKIPLLYFPIRGSYNEDILKQLQNTINFVEKTEEEV